MFPHLSVQQVRSLKQKRCYNCADFVFLRSSSAAHLHALPVEIHFDQRVSYQVSEATAVEVAVGTGVVLAVVNLWEL